jgi:hypothetical protein
MVPIGETGRVASWPGEMSHWNTTTLAAGAHPLADVARNARALTPTSPPVHLTVDVAINATRDCVAGASDVSLRVTQMRPDSPRG